MDINTRSESDINVREKVGGQEDDTLEVFQFPEENWNQFISSNVANGTLGHEHICFVKKNYSVPVGGHFENFLDPRTE